MDSDSWVDPLQGHSDGVDFCIVVLCVGGGVK